jgi:hypothetical protein
MTVKTTFLASLYIFGYMLEPGLESGKIYFQNGKYIYMILFFKFQILATKRPPKALNFCHFENFIHHLVKIHPFKINKKAK